MVIPNKLYHRDHLPLYHQSDIITTTMIVIIIIKTIISLAAEHKHFWGAQTEKWTYFYAGLLINNISNAINLLRLITVVEMKISGEDTQTKNMLILILVSLATKKIMQYFKVASNL